MDNCGPITPPSLNNKKYYNLIEDDRTRLKKVFFMRTTAETPDALKSYTVGTIRPAERKLKAVRTDSAPECSAGETKRFCEANGIVQEVTVAEQHSQNAVVERGIGVLTQMARSAMQHWEPPAPPQFWAEAVAAAEHVSNRMPCSTNEGHQSPLQLWTGSKEQPSVSHLRTWGCYVVFKHTER